MGLIPFLPRLTTQEETVDAGIEAVSVISLSGLSLSNQHLVMTLSDVRLRKGIYGGKRLLMANIKIKNDQEAISYIIMWIAGVITLLGNEL